MDESDRKAFATAIGALAVVYRREADQTLLEAYWMFLKELDLRQIQTAVAEAGRTLEFMPTPSELRSLAGIISPSQRAVYAYATVLRGVPEIGSYRSVDFEDRAINATVRFLGGWPSVLARLAADETEEKWARQEFLKTYAVLAQRPVGDEAGAPCEGLSQCTVTRDGVSPPIPRFIACPDSVAAEDRGRQAGKLGQKRNADMPSLEFKKVG